LYAHVFDWNGASARVLEKAGYEFEGRLRKSVTKDGRTIDQLIYAIIREKQ
jgi:RimJ/RimL family protein N-acetyltransferase